MKTYARRRPPAWICFSVGHATAPHVQTRYDLRFPDLFGVPVTIQVLPEKGNYFPAFAEPCEAIPPADHVFLAVQIKANPLVKLRLFPAAIVKRMFLGHERKLATLNRTARGACVYCAGKKYVTIRR